MVPQSHQRVILWLAYDIPDASHLDQQKTLAQLLARFFWPGVHRSIKDYCTFYLECQLAVPPGILKAPLVLLLVVGTPFKRAAMDLVGLLVKNAMGFCYILVVMDYATCFPEAVLLRSTTARTITADFLKIFTQVGLPQEILTDQRMNFTSRLLCEVYGLLRVQHLWTSVYHPPDRWVG